INDAVLDLDHATQKNVSFAARMAQTNQELEGLAESITETVQVFRIDSGRRERPDAVALRRPQTCCLPGAFAVTQACETADQPIDVPDCHAEKNDAADIHPDSHGTQNRE